MVEGLKQLIELQALDGDLSSAESELGRIPEARVALAAKREAADARLVAAKAEVTAAESIQRGAETELQDKEALLAKLETQQHQVKTNEAYSALLREMEEAKQAISGAETQILESMETIEAANTVCADVEREVAAQLEHSNTEAVTLDDREQKVGQRAEELRNSRAALFSQVPSDLATQYERIGQRCTPAVAQVLKEVCQGCRVNIPPQLHIELMNADKVHVCPNCRRLLIPEGIGN